MHYPWWYVPYITAPMLIAVISVVHVLVSHYAVGGGLFLAVEVGHARRARDSEYLNYLRGHARFFVLLTVVFGAITGVGIWWTIGLTSPLATEVLIRTFVFGWATEWVFFVVELVAAFIFLYYWDRLPEKTHVVIGWIYALAAWISLVLITGITAFMLNSGDWAFHPGSRNFWVAFFNPQFLPQTIARTGGALLLSSLYVYLHASLKARNSRLRDMIASRSARPAMLGAALVTAGGIGWYAFLPDTAAATLASAAVLNVLMALIFALTVVVFVLLYFGPYRNPGWLSPGFAGSLCLFGIAAFTTGEFIREAVRKPFVVDGVVLANQILPSEVAKLRSNGYLNGGTWTKAYIQHYLQTVGDRPVSRDKVEKSIEPSKLRGGRQLAHGMSVAHEGSIDDNRLRKLPSLDRSVLGKVLFLYHCNDCHAGRVGYSALGPLLQGRPRSVILDRIERLDDVYFMPPWCGTDEEAEVLTDYLMTISPREPPGKRPWENKARGAEPTEGGTP
ncbi:MAG: cytochrome ubiquinol oxidase subunit I [Thermoguttaceae bacterium]